MSCFGRGSIKGGLAGINHKPALSRFANAHAPYRPRGACAPSLCIGFALRGLRRGRWSATGSWTAPEDREFKHKGKEFKHDPALRGRRARTPEGGAARGIQRKNQGREFPE